MVSKNISHPRLFLGPDFPDFSHFLYCVHRHTPHCPSSSEPKGSPRHPNGLPWGESARGFPLPRQMGVFSDRSRFFPLSRGPFCVGLGSWCADWSGLGLGYVHGSCTAQPVMLALLMLVRASAPHPTKWSPTIF